MLRLNGKSGESAKSQGRLYETVAERLSEDILSKKYAPDDILPSERDLCAIMNVSRITIRRALSELSKKGWIRSVSGKGNIVTRHAGSVMPPVAILLRQKTFDETMAHGATSLLLPLSGVVDECRKLNVPFNIELYDKELEFEDFLVNRRSLILLEWSTYELLASFLSENGDYPVVSCFHAIPEDWLSNEPDIPGCVVYDDGNGVSEAMEWLFAQGRREVAYISKDNRNHNVISRKLAYVDAMRSKGLESLIFDGNIEAEGNDDAPELAVQVNRARKLIGDYLDSGSRCPDAIVATSDAYAFGAYDELRTRGINVHERCTVVGFNDSDLASLTVPPLHSVEKPLLESGAVAVRILRDLSRGGKGGRIVMKSRFRHL